MSKIRIEISRRKKRLIKQLLEFCLEQSTIGNDMFFRYSPHIQVFEVRAYEGGWSSEKQPESSIQLHVGDDFYSYEDLFRLVTEFMANPFKAKFADYDDTIINLE